MRALVIPQRNQLVWLTELGWQTVMAQQWDEAARHILNHWHTQQLPLVATTQHDRTNPSGLPLGLPAPTCWGRRKLALQVSLDAVERVDGFPSLDSITPVYECLSGMDDFIAHMHRLQVPLQVYGSFGWQAVSGMEYVRATSDLDLRACVPDLNVARATTLALDALQLPLRVDGELVFPDGSAVAWRELLQWMRGTVQQVMVKSAYGVYLAEPASDHFPRRYAHTNAAEAIV